MYPKQFFVSIISALLRTLSALIMGGYAMGVCELSAAVVVREPLEAIEGRSVIRIVRPKHFEASAAVGNITIYDKKGKQHFWVRNGDVITATVFPGNIRIVGGSGDRIYLDCQPGSTCTVEFRIQVGRIKGGNEFRLEGSDKTRIMTYPTSKTPIVFDDQTSKPSKSKTLVKWCNIPACYEIVEATNATDRANLLIRFKESAYNYSAELMERSSNRVLWTGRILKVDKAVDPQPIRQVTFDSREAAESRETSILISKLQSDGSAFDPDSNLNQFYSVVKKSKTTDGKGELLECNIFKSWSFPNPVDDTISSRLVTESAMTAGKYKLIYILGQLLAQLPEIDEKGQPLMSDWL